MQIVEGERFPALYEMYAVVGTISVVADLAVAICLRKHVVADEFPFVTHIDLSACQYSH